MTVASEEMGMREDGLIAVVEAALFVWICGGVGSVLHLRSQTPFGLMDPFSGFHTKMTYVPVAVRSKGFLLVPSFGHKVVVRHARRHRELSGGNFVKEKKDRTLQFVA